MYPRRFFIRTYHRDNEIAEYRQDRIPNGEFQTVLAEGLTEEGAVHLADLDAEVRYWSDFNRVSFIPRTIQRLPDSPDWENTDGDWNVGKELFARYNAV